MERDELAWIDSVPVRPARGKKITIGEFEWSEAAPENAPARRTARFWLNSTELLAILVEETTVAHGGSTGQITDAPPPRVRIGGRSYLLFVEAPTQRSTA